MALSIITWAVALIAANEVAKWVQLRASPKSGSPLGAAASSFVCVVVIAVQAWRYAGVDWGELVTGVLCGILLSYVGKKARRR